MFIRILEETKNELRIEIGEEGHTFCNPLQKVLLEDKGVEIAGYNIAHPLRSNPTVYIRTKGNLKPKTVLQKAVKKLLERSNEFRIAYEKALKIFGEASS